MAKKILPLLLVLLIVCELAISQLNVLAASYAWYVSAGGSDTTGNGSTGNPWESIQYAINQAADGDTIYVGAGDYTENITVSKSLTVESLEGRDTTIVTAADPGENVITVTADGVTISGFTVTGYGEYMYGIFLDGIELDKVIDCVISDNLCTTSLSSPPSATYPEGDKSDSPCGVTAYIFADGIGLYYADDNTVTGNICTSNGSTGIYISNSSGNIVSGNECNENYRGIAINCSTGCTILNNVISNNTNYGIETDESTDILVRQNDITNNSRGIDCDSVLSTVVEYNNIWGNTDYGVYNGSTSPENELNAENNWWGDATGPYHENNAAGQGDNVTDYVDYDPWLGYMCEKMEITGALTGSFAFAASGMVLEDVQVFSEDGKLTLIIPEGTYILDGNGDPVYEIGVSLTLENTFDGSIISLEFTPDGTTFSGYITLIYYYGESLTDAEASELVFVYYDGSDWKILPTLVDSEIDTIAVLFNHFTSLALVEYQDLITSTTIATTTQIQTMTVNNTETQTTTVNNTETQTRTTTDIRTKTRTATVKIPVTQTYIVTKSEIISSIQTMTTTESSFTTVVSTQILPPVTYTEAGVNVTVTEKTTSVTTQVKNVDVTDWSLTVIIGIGALLAGALIIMLFARR